MRTQATTLASILAITWLFAACRESGGGTPTADAPEKTQSPVETVKAPPVTSVQWVDSIRDMGTIKEGEKVEIPFRFKNTGTEQLVISRVDVACGCTVAEKPEQPVGPGREGVIKASFDSRGRPGPNHKTLTVHANTSEQMHTLIFDVEVRGKE
jgi:hypothetical protein